MASANDGWREEDRLKARWIFAYGEDRLTRLDGPLILMIFMVNYDRSSTTRLIIVYDDALIRQSRF
jgi:hypothetical protein